MPLPPKKKYPEWFDVALIFAAVLFGVSSFLAFFAHIFAGHWYMVSMKDELPNALILSTTATSLIIVIQYLVSGRAQKIITYGLTLISLEVFLELPLKKYVALVPYVNIKQWFFLFGVAEFAGMLSLFLGLSMLMINFQKNTS